jgi:hypothetical protein
MDSASNNSSKTVKEAHQSAEHWSPWNTVENSLWTRHTQYIRAFLAIHASVFFWVGLSNLVTESASFRQDQSILVLGKSTLARDSMLSITGILMLVATDSFYGNSGLPGSFLRYNWKWNRKAWIVVLRATFSLVGAVLTWTGIYNILDVHLGLSSYSLLRNIAFFVVGWIGTVLTNTFYPMAMVFPQGFQMEDPDHVGFDWKRHVKETSRALICLFFQNLLWCGGFNIVENNIENHGVVREIIFTVIGLVLLLVCKAFVPNAWIFTEHPDHDFTELKQLEGESQSAPENDNINQSSIVEPESFAPDSPVAEESKIVQIKPPGFLFKLRASCALSAQILHNSGFWTLIDAYLSMDSWYRNLLYLIFGLFLVLLTGGGGGKRTKSNIFDNSRDHIPAPLVQ